MLGLRFGLLIILLALYGSTTVRAQLLSPSPAATPTSSSAPPATAGAIDGAAATPSPLAEKVSAGMARSEGRSAAIVLPPEKAQPVKITRFEKSPVINGLLDDEAWQHATLLKDFYQIQPGDNIAPSKPTEVLLGYDDKFLYVAFRAYDEADRVRANVAKRDQIFDDDYVGIYLDTYNDQRKAYELFFNPLGIQADGILTEGRGEDFSVDVVMQSKGVLTDKGYNVEIAIPFKSLRYEAGKSRMWGVHFLRVIKRFNGEQSSWMPISRDNSGFLNQSGHITGLEGLSSERTLEIIPSLTLSQTGRRVSALTSETRLLNPGALDPGRIVNESLKVDPGLTVKFGITPTITLDFALNPDFAQVEADQTVVTANQRFPIFFEEKRPFFLEGIDVFQTALNPVHTRTIVDPDYAVKLSGKRGRNTFGILLASDNAPGNYTEDERTTIRENLERFTNDPVNTRFDSRIRLVDRNATIGVLRLKRDIGKENSLGFLATTYNFVDRHNHLGGFDGRFRLDPQTTFGFQVLGTNSRRFFFDPDLGRNVYRTGNGLGYFWNYDHVGRHFSYNFRGSGRTQDYRADVGFTQRTNTNREDAIFRYASEPKPKARLISWQLFNKTGLNFDWQGRMQNSDNESQFKINLRRETSLSFGFFTGYERVFEEEFGLRRSATQPGEFAGDAERSTYKKDFFIYGQTTPTKKFTVFYSLDYYLGALDFDFGSPPNYPRVSPTALRFGQGSQLDPGPGKELIGTLDVTYQPTEALRLSLTYTKDRLVRYDTGRVAFDQNIAALRATYQFTRFTFLRARLDYNTLSPDAQGEFLPNIRGQFLLGWTPSPGTAFYVGYNDDINRNGRNPFTGEFEPGFRRNGRTFFIKASYLFRRSIN
jgi:hypothetical protein